MHTNARARLALARLSLTLSAARLARAYRTAPLAPSQVIS